MSKFLTNIQQNTVRLWLLALTVLAVSLFTQGCIEFRDSPFGDEIFSPIRNANTVYKKYLESHMTSDNFRFAFITDTHMDHRDFQAVIDILNTRHDIDFIVIGGDFTHNSYASEYDLALNVLETSHLPFLTVIGNHDALGVGPQIFKKVFGPKDFTVEFANTKLILWNNNSLEFDNRLNYDWFADEVEAAAEDEVKQVIVIQHLNLDNGLYFENNRIEEMRSFAGASNIDLILNGHRHEFFTKDLENVIIHQGARVRGQQYSIVQFQDGALSIVNCRGRECAPAAM